MIKLYNSEGICSIIDAKLPDFFSNKIKLNKVPIGKITNLYAVRNTLLYGESDGYTLNDGYIENIDFGNHDEFDDCINITLKFDKIVRK